MLVCITTFLCSFALVAYTINAWSKLKPLVLLLFNSISIVQVWNLDGLGSRLVTDHKFLKVWTANILHILQVLNSLSHSDSRINKKIKERSFFRFRLSGNVPVYLLIKLGSKQVNTFFSKFWDKQSKLFRVKLPFISITQHPRLLSNSLFQKTRTKTAAIQKFLSMQTSQIY